MVYLFVFDLFKFFEVIYFGSVYQNVNLVYFVVDLVCYFLYGFWICDFYCEYLIVGDFIGLSYFFQFFLIFVCNEDIVLRVFDYFGCFGVNVIGCVYNQYFFVG